MPYIEGDTLKEVLLDAQTAPLQEVYSIPSFIRLFKQVCSAVAFAHAKNRIHRDLKPSNILVDLNGNVFVIDWGLINVVGSETSEGEGKISGTIPYLAPELVFGNKPNYQSDIYSLGLILFQLLTLRFPFLRITMDQYLTSVDYETLIEPSKISFSRIIPSLLSKITLKCLEYDPKKRYQTVDELIEDLNDYKESDAPERTTLSMITSTKISSKKISHEDRSKTLEENIPKAYFQDDIDVSIEKFQKIDKVLSVGFFLKDTASLVNLIPETMEQPAHLQLLEGIFLALIELDALDLALTHLQKIMTDELNIQAAIHLVWIEQLIHARQGSFNGVKEQFLKLLPPKLNKQMMHFVICLLNSCVKHHQIDFLWETIDHLMSLKYSAEQRCQLTYYAIWSNLEEKNWDEAEALFKQYPQEIKEGRSFFDLYQKFLQVKNN